MKLVVTILQARRAVLPRLFVQHVVPRMREAGRARGLEVEVVIVRHRTLPTGADSFLATSQAHVSQAVERIEQWTRDGHYEGATLIVHDVQHGAYPSMPSYHLACEAALERRADFHLWIEDDALVWDRSFSRWPELFGSREVGVYRSFSAINSAFFVSKRAFDARIVGALAKYPEWSRERRIEPWLQRQLHTPRAYLNPSYAVRSHKNRFPYTGDHFVVQMVRALCPEDAHLLDLELGPGASRLPPPTRMDMAWLTARDWGRPVELARRLRTLMWEKAGKQNAT